MIDVGQPVALISSIENLGKGSIINVKKATIDFGVGKGIAANAEQCGMDVAENGLTKEVFVLFMNEQVQKAKQVPLASCVLGIDEPLLSRIPEDDFFLVDNFIATLEYSYKLEAPFSFNVANVGLA